MDTTVLKTEAEIQQRVRELAAQMHCGLPIVLVPILVGGMMFCADLARNLPADTMIYPCVAKGADIISRPYFRWQNHDIWIVDNTLQTGETLRVVRRLLPMAKAVVLAELLCPWGGGGKATADLVGWKFTENMNVVGYGGDFTLRGRGYADLRRVDAWP